MDNICHTLVGAALAETGLRRRTRFATAALILGANLPDIDIPGAFTEYGLGFRRGITHGIPALLVLPFVLTGALMLWARLRGAGREVVPRQLLLLSALALLTHPVLDWMNVYGMRWFMPFDGTWTYGDSLFIIDPWLLVLLGSGWIAGRRSRRDAGEGGARGSEGVARLMLAASAVYVLVMVGITTVGRRVAARDLGLVDPSPKQLMVSPPFLASWRREVIVDTGPGYRFGEIVWFPRPVLRLAGGEIPKRLEALRAVPSTVALENLLAWARFPFVERIGDRVYADDARYGAGGRSFAAVEISSER